MYFFFFRIEKLSLQRKKNKYVMIEEVPSIKSAKKLKGVLFKILSIVSPLIILAFLGIMQGAWFDIEEFVEKGDAEIYRPTILQYLLYYLTSITLLIFSFLLLKYEFKSASNSFYRIFCVVLLILDISIIIICSFQT